ncbi:MAG TPA: OmpH family outer membrane protein [Bacteroidales bacterium]|nr:OmpH family outer membrane protein [Bacteroidales bacterium]HPF03036.1 OmpH family outer membrane protein [Bacteroidales bacterium]HPJ59846.1 OmpH family outer membrane protein [Bacteroidales bacterium]HPR12706.1 OmpH family outer membrane protein [Bacteroidales bacterium]HRW85576.1 OmpH family outer membrane protein [Bacteroidales bacterium]
MKKLDIALFALLFVAVGLLYVLHFTTGKEKKSADVITENTSPDLHGIAFVNIDSVIYHFDMFFDRRNELLEKQKNAEAEVNSKRSSYEKNARDFQEKVTKGLVTRATAAEMEQALYQQQQDLLALHENLQAQLLEEEQVMNRQIVDYITTFLEDNKSDYKYQYILGKSFGSPVLYGDRSLDITQRIIDALNIKYQDEKK